MLCPRCRIHLNRATTKQGIVFCCPQCRGRAVALAVLRRVGSKRCVQQLWQQAWRHKGQQGAPCPVCDRAMAQLPLAANRPFLQLDICTSCEFVWFDPREFEQFPPPDPQEPLSKEARQLIAEAEVRQEAQRAEREAYNEPGPDEPWKWIPAVLGMPVEENVPAVRSWPWLTWGMAASLVAVFAMTAGNLNAAAEEYGLIPAELWRHHGATFITSFFLHASIWHLIGNVYFLLVFGDNVEDDVGPWGYLALLAIADLVGNMWHILADCHSMVPCIGASGGISGVVTFYALRFPRARLGILFRWFVYFRWVHLPAYQYLLFWFLLQFVLVFEQHLGVGNVAAWAHLGGAAVGAVAWFLWRSDSLFGRKVV
jgi:membrane associated rhomboid family serine protease